MASSGSKKGWHPKNCINFEKCIFSDSLKILLIVGSSLNLLQEFFCGSLLSTDSIEHREKSGT